MFMQTCLIAPSLRLGTSGRGREGGTGGRRRQDQGGGREWRRLHRTSGERRPRGQPRSSSNMAGCARTAMPRLGEPRLAKTACSRRPPGRLPGAGAKEGASRKVENHPRAGTHEGGARSGRRSGKDETDRKLDVLARLGSAQSEKPLRRGRSDRATSRKRRAGSASWPARGSSHRGAGRSPAPAEEMLCPKPCWNTNGRPGRAPLKCKYH